MPTSPEVSSRTLQLVHCVCVYVCVGVVYYMPLVPEKKNCFNKTGLQLCENRASLNSE